MMSKGLLHCTSFDYTHSVKLLENVYNGVCISETLCMC